VPHLTYDRASVISGGSNWSSHALYAELADVIERFAQAVDPAKICDDFGGRIEAAVSPRDKPTEGQRPFGYSARPAGLAAEISSATARMPPRGNY
jgi:hypothetical protein